MEEILKQYCDNGMKNLKNISYNIFIKFGGICQADYDDFYSIANYTLFQCLADYNDSLNDNFDLFLKNCLTNKFKTELTRRNRQKRIQRDMTISLDSTVNDDNVSLSELIADSKNDIDSVGSTDEYSYNMEQYLNSLTVLQKDILTLLADNYSKEDICEVLNISSYTYQSNLNEIRSFEKTRILMRGA